MKTFTTYVVACTAAVLLMPLLPVVGFAAEDLEGVEPEILARGEASYMANCASCHGENGTGDGSVAEYLTVKPTDLTKIGTDEGGEFPFDDIYEIVDGRSVAGHGSREMPVWGPAFKGMDEEAGKKVIKERIVELVYYLKSIQG